MDINDRTQAVSLKNRKELIIDGVTHVVGFDSDYVCLETNLGRITVEGKNLVIDNLSKKDGEISILGDISGIFYSENRLKDKGFLSRFTK